MSLTIYIYILNICSIPILVHFTRPCFPPVFELSRGRLVGDGLLFLSCLRGWCQWIQGTLYRKPAFLLQISLQPSLILGKWGSCKEKMAEFQQRRFSQCEIGKFQYVSVRLGNLQLIGECTKHFDPFARNDQASNWLFFPPGRRATLNEHLPLYWHTWLAHKKCNP